MRLSHFQSVLLETITDIRISCCTQSASYVAVNPLAYSGHCVQLGGRSLETVSSYIRVRGLPIQ